MAKKIKELRHIDLTKIENPEFLKTLNNKELKLLCEDIRKYLIQVVSKNGGHLSSNLGVVESTVALCKTFDFSKDKIIFDVGHQCYTYKLLTGRKLEGLRTKDGISGFQKISESKYDHYEAGHSSTSISAANGMAIARDLNGEKYDIIAFIGDASIANGLAIEGLNNCAADKKHKVIIVLNDNEMSISKNVGGFSKMLRKFSNSAFYCKNRNAYVKIMNKTAVGRKIYDFTASIKNWFKRHLIQMSLFDYLGFGVIGPIDGHNVKRIEQALQKAQKMDKSVIVYLKTVKGKGYEYSEKDNDGVWHGVGPFDIETGEFKCDPNKTSWSRHYADLLFDEMNSNDKIYTIVPGTMYGSCLNKVFEFFPDRCADVGIAEEHAAVFAAGLARNGYHPVVSMYSTFLQRAYDEVSHDLARMNLNATLLIDRSGLVGQDGNTHQGIYDEGYLYSIPNTVITMATNANESASLLKESFNKHGVFAIRYPRGGFETSSLKSEHVDIPFGSWIISNEINTNENCVIGVGPNIEKVKQLIIEKGLNVKVIKAIYLKPINENMLKSLLGFKKIVIYDSYSTINGFTNSVSSKLMELGFKGQVILKAIPDTFVDQASVSQQEEKYGLLPEQIIDLF